MFQSTQCLTFRTIAPFGSLKIHPPLPLTPRESTQLLNLLTTSFRRHLDREHGVTSSEGGATHHVPAFSSHPKLAPGNRQHLQSRSDIRAPTDRHLHSILTNPLFKDVKTKSDTRSQHRRSPMEIFDEAVAKGFMKVEYAEAYLKAEKRKILYSSTLSVRDAMKSSLAGSRTLKWMLSSGVANDGLFLENQEFTGILVEFLMAEGLQSVIWAWLETLFAKISSAGTKAAANFATRDASNLLYNLVKAQTSESGNLDIGIRSLAKAENMLSKLQYECRPLLKGAAKYLSRQIVNPPRSRLPCSPDMFELFQSTMPKILSSKHEIASSNLLLYHPTNPDAEPAIKCLEKAMKIASAATNPGAKRVVLEIYHYKDSAIIHLGLNTARFLLERGHQTKAHWVLNFLEETYGKHLGLSEKDLLSLHDQAHAEASSLELLSNLNLT